MALKMASIQVETNARREDIAARNRNLTWLCVSGLIGVLGLSYASVPLYRMFCQVTGFGGTTQEYNVSGVGFNTATEDTTIVEDAKPIIIRFNSDVANSLPWTFRPEQTAVQVRPGETTLAFYRANNKSKDVITGVATYNVQPPKAGIYFNKIQCFCFEEQQLRAKEAVDMPVFFFIDPEFAEDPYMEDVEEILLSYTFFRTEDVDVEEIQRQQITAQGTV